MWVWTDVILGHEGGVTTEREFWARNPLMDEKFQQYKKVEENGDNV
jgi:hypothetical protein